MMYFMSGIRKVKGVGWMPVRLQAVKLVTLLPLACSGLLSRSHNVPGVWGPVCLHLHQTEVRAADGSLGEDFGLEYVMRGLVGSSTRAVLWGGSEFCSFLFFQ